MSLESYKRSLAAQREREMEFSQFQPLQQHPAQEYTHKYSEQTTTKKRGFGKLIFSLLIIALLIVASIKNPSASETKSIIKNTLVEKINERMGAEMMDDKNDGFKQFGAFISMTIAPHLIDHYTDIDVEDYIVFSTFNCTTKDKEDGGNVKTIISGIIVFGKIIPLKSDLNIDNLNYK